MNAILLKPYTPLLLTATAPTLRAFSYGGGVQSNAVLALQALGRLPNPYDVFIFANVGEDSENPATLEYVETVAKPFAEKHGIKLVEVQKTYRGEPDTLLKRIERSPMMPIPVRASGNGKPNMRICTVDYKIKVADKWIGEQTPAYAIVGLGISLDEVHRMRDTQWHETRGGQHTYQKRREYPLIDLRLRRNDCHNILREAGLPDAPKSACWWCPHMKHGEWIEMLRNDPERFKRVVMMESDKNALRDWNDRFYFHRSLMPLDQAVGHQLPLWPDEEQDNCESGYCLV